MKNGKFDVGTLIKGKDLKDYILVKVISEDMVMRDFQYKIGMNEDTVPLIRKGGCKAGLHFCLMEDICNYLFYGEQLAIISVPDDEDVYVDAHKFRTHRLVVENVMPFSDAAVWQYMYENGAYTEAGKREAVDYAVQSGNLVLLKHLHEKGIDILAYDSIAVRFAAREGNLDVIKYLYENGADIYAKDNSAERLAVDYGHTEIVEYLQGIRRKLKQDAARKAL